MLLEKNFTMLWPVTIFGLCDTRTFKTICPGWDRARTLTISVHVLNCCFCELIIFTKSHNGARALFEVPNSTQKQNKMPSLWSYKSSTLWKRELKELRSIAPAPTTNYNWRNLVLQTISWRRIMGSSKNSELSVVNTGKSRFVSSQSNCGICKQRFFPYNIEFYIRDY